MLLKLIATSFLVVWGTIISAEATIKISGSTCLAIVCGTGSSIYIDGEFGGNEAERLDALIREKNLTIYSTVYLNSPGGSLRAGMDLARVIRKYRFNTSVGELLQNGKHSGDGAICMSACTFAFLGGEFRYFSDKSLFGVHRFFSNDPIENELAVAQITSARIISFLMEMEIKPDFFVETTKASSDSIRLLSRDQMLEFGFANNGMGSTKWAVTAPEASPDTSFLYLKGERNTSYGIQKVLFFCSPSRGGIAAHVIFDPQGRTEEARMMKAISIEIDDQKHSLAEFLVGETEIVNGWLNATFNVPRNLWIAIKGAKEVGFLFQFTYDAPVFLGISGMPLIGSKGFMAGIENSCEPYVDEKNTDFQRYINTDFFGDDLTKMGIKGVSISQCEDICEAMNQCNAYSFVEHLNWCFPKSGIGTQTYKTGIISGFR